MAPLQERWDICELAAPSRSGRQPDSSVLTPRTYGEPSPLTRVPKTGWQAQAMRGKRWGHDTHKERRRFQIPIEVSMLFANVSLATAYWSEKQKRTRL